MDALALGWRRVGPLGRRHVRSACRIPLTLGDPQAAKDFFSACVAAAGCTRESLWVAHVDRNGCCLHLSRHEGGEASADFPLRDIVIDAALHGSAGLLLAHNHPSGDPTPSAADCRATRRLASAAEALDCAILDHLVFAGGHCASFRGLGLL